MELNLRWMNEDLQVHLDIQSGISISVLQTWEFKFPSQELGVFVIISAPRSLTSTHHFPC